MDTENQVKFSIKMLYNIITIIFKSKEEVVKEFNTETPSKEELIKYIKNG